MKIHELWIPEGDTPITITLSREQLQVIQNLLRGQHSGASTGGRALFADRIEQVLRDSIAAPVETQEKGDQ